MIDSTGTLVLERLDTLPADRFDGGRATDWSLALPIDRLGAGEYLLTVQATAGQTEVRRDARFSRQ